MKRGFPNRRRLFIQNLKNRRVLAGCMGVEAATDDLITEEAAEVHYNDCGRSGKGTWRFPRLRATFFFQADGGRAIWIRHSSGDPDQGPKRRCYDTPPDHHDNSLRLRATAA
ncbi:hypothetical protein [Rhodopirellula baltica]|nr:hypothetical protein [Rhodopirellula baltica]